MHFGYYKNQNTLPSHIPNYPWFKNVDFVLGLFISGQIYYSKIKKDYYQSMHRCDEIDNLPYLKGTYVRWCPERKGLVVKDVPYEGKLIKSKEFTKKHKMYKDALVSLQDDAIVGELLGGDFEFDHHISVPYNTSEKAEYIETKLVDFFKGTHDSEDFKKLCCCLGTHRITYNYQRNPSYLFERLENAKAKVPVPVKQRIMFNLGAYDLPDDYLNWFDG